MRSSIEIWSMRTGQSRVVHQSERLLEAPNFTDDGKALIINGDGHLYRLDIAAGSEPIEIPTNFAKRCNNDHGISPDGKLIALTDKCQHGRAVIYTVPIEGGIPIQVSPSVNSYWHGWSPDGQRITYCGIRNQEFDIYTNATAGGDEKRLTLAEGRNDGPDYSPDGAWIYFNSDRSGLMQIWRIRPDGSDVERVTHDAFGDWFPHPSPNGHDLVFVSYDADVIDHPRDLNVRIRHVNLNTGTVRVLFDLFGGQGTMNVPNWSPSGDAFAFVRYFPA
jgi:Tol biopolymer transport system component